MDANQITEFSRRLVALAEVFDVKLSPQRQALYFEALRDLPLDRVIAAMNQTLQTAKFFPRPAEIRALAVGDSDTREESAWMTLRQMLGRIGSYRSVVFDDPALGEAVLALFGSWPQACQAELTPEMWAAKRKEFSRVYRVLLGRNIDGTRYLMGECERSNAGRRGWEQFTPIARIGRDGDLAALPPAQAEEAREQIAMQSHELTRLGDVVKTNLHLVKGMDETA